MRKLYYVVEKELQQIEDVEETTGHKSIYVYTVAHNELAKFFTLDIQNEDSTIDAIREYLDDNGYEDESFNLVQL